MRNEFNDDEIDALYEQRDEPALLLGGLADECRLGEEQAIAIAREFVIRALECEDHRVLGAMLDGMAVACGIEDVAKRLMRRAAERN